MKIKILKRKIIIREYDFNKVKEQAFAPLSCMGIIDSLYDRATFIPISQENLEKMKLIKILQGKIKKRTNLDLKMPAILIADFEDYLYDDRYCSWNISIDEQGYLCVQARKNTPKSRLGWGIFEKDHKCLN